MRWTEERDAELRRLWESGVSHGKAAAQMGLTRSQVCGRARRIGLVLPDGDIRKRKAMQIGWTPERDADLISLVEQGTPQRAIAEHFGVSRRQIYGRCAALNLKRPERPVVERPKRVPTVQLTPEQLEERRRTARDRLAKIVEILESETADSAIPLIGRPFGACGWPVGTPERPAEQLCCGLSVKGDGFVYCAQHHEIAFQPGTGMSPREVGRLSSMAGRATRRPASFNTHWDAARAA